MDVPRGYRFRAPAPGDLEAVAGLLVAGGTALDADFVRHEWSRSGFEVATDAWVAVAEDGTVVGYGHARQEGRGLVESWGAVHPEHQGRGIGSSLLNRVEERASEMLDGLPTGRFRHSIRAGDRAATAILRARGLLPVRHFWRMQMDLPQPFDPGLAPRGVTIRGLGSPDDLRAVHAVLSKAFDDHWDHHPESFDRWAQEQARSPSYDPALWLIATEGGAPVGALTASVGGDRGWVDELGVLASHRGRGIGRALLSRSFAAFARLGLHRVLLNVDAENPTGATALYERVGMRVVDGWEVWERSSGAPATP